MSDPKIIPLPRPRSVSRAWPDFDTELQDYLERAHKIELGLEELGRHLATQPRFMRWFLRQRGKVRRMYGKIEVGGRRASELAVALVDNRLVVSFSVTIDPPSDWRSAAATCGARL